MTEFLHSTVVFPVVFYNGDCQMNVGNIENHPTLNFKQFRKILKQMLGVPYKNLTTYFVDDDISENSPEQPDVLITSKFRFSDLVPGKYRYFLVVLKRSKRGRRRTPQNRSPEQHMFASDTYCYEDGFNMLHMQRENYACMVLSLNISFPIVTEEYTVVQSDRNRALCEDCVEAEKKGEKPEFHLCVNDDVVEGFFRSPVGPISRRR